jgi:transcriptional regulator with XRE-family HTH domain
MDQQQIIGDLERRAAAIGLTMSHICDRAGVHRTTFSRWKRSERNPDPIGATLDTLGKLGSALSAAEEEAAGHDASDTKLHWPMSGNNTAETISEEQAA